MNAINIFLTDALGEEAEDFTHGETRYAFARLYPDGPHRVIEGPVYIFVDWVMDELSGLEMCRRLRADSRTQDAHITIVLDDDDPQNKRRALRAGADDYMIGPVMRSALLDRVMVLQAGSGQTAVSDIHVLGDLTIDAAALRARWAGEPLDLRPNEFRLLRFFAQNPDRVLTRAALIAALGKQEPPIDERTVDVWIGRLRSAMRHAGSGDRVRTVRFLGYVYDSH